jgi:hypothetical protein
MNSVTIAIPNRWQRAAGRILLFLQDEMRIRQDACAPYEITLGGEWDAGKIWLLNSTLDTNQEMFCQASVNELSSAIDANYWDEWKAAHEVTEQAQRDIEEIRGMLDEYLGEEGG